MGFFFSTSFAGSAAELLPASVSQPSASMPILRHICICSALLLTGCEGILVALIGTETRIIVTTQDRGVGLGGPGGRAGNRRDRRGPLPGPGAAVAARRAGSRRASVSHLCRLESPDVPGRAAI